MKTNINKPEVQTNEINSKEFLLNVPIYSEVDITNVSPFTVLDYLYYTGSLECYCPLCKKPSIFNDNHSIGQRQNSVPFDRTVWINNFYDENHREDIYCLDPPNVLKPDFEPPFHYKNYDHGWGFQCSYNHNHTIIFYIKIVDNKIFKYGQYPSQIDLTSDQLDKYSSVLERVKFNELKRSYYLYTYDIGIGSMAYLRRVFEFLIDEVHQQRKTEQGEEWNEKEYLEKSMSDRVEFLKDFLPKYLVDNRTYIYGILSKGVHELTDEECIEHFPTMLTSIELILNERLYQKDIEKTIKENKNNLRKIHSKISK